MRRIQCSFAFVDFAMLLLFQSLFEKKLAFISIWIFLYFSPRILTITICTTIPLPQCKPGQVEPAYIECGNGAAAMQVSQVNSFELGPTKLGEVQINCPKKETQR